MKKVKGDYLANAELFWSGEQHLDKCEWLSNQLMQLPFLSNLECLTTDKSSAKSVLKEIVPRFQSLAEFEVTNERLKKAWAQHKSRIKKNQSAQKAFTTYLTNETLSKLKQISQIEHKQISRVVEELINWKYAKLSKSGKIKEPSSLDFQSEFTQYSVNMSDVWQNT